MPVDLLAPANQDVGIAKQVPPAVQEFVSLRASLVSRSGKLFENRRRYLVSSAGIERKRSPSIAKVTSEQLRGGAPVLRTQCGVCSDDCRNGVR